MNIESLAVNRREIVGIAGVSGNGQAALIEVLGGQRAALAGTVSIADRPYHARRGEAFTQKVRVLPEEPLRNGCVANLSVEDNLNLRSFRSRRAQPPPILA